MKNKHFITRLCTLALGVVLSVGTTTTLFAATTDGVQHEFNGNKYQIFDDTMTWTDAKAFCEEQGGHLVTITSQEEQDFIQNILTGAASTSYWIGAYVENAPALDANFTWVTGEAFDYSNWGHTPGFDQPDHSFNGEEAYVGIVTSDRHYANAFEWNDFRNDDFRESFGFVCEWENSSNDVEEVNPFEYVLFSGSTDETLFIQGAKANIKGNIYAGNDINTYDSNKLEVKGNINTVNYPNLGNKTTIKGVTAQVNVIEMPDWDSSILDKITVAETAEDVNYSKSQNIKTSIRTTGNVNIENGTYNYKGLIVADGDITIDASKFSSSSGALLYSRNGNITIKGDNFNFKGIIYAPNGTVTVEANKNNITGRIFADKVLIDSNKFDIKAGSNDEAIVK